MKQENKTIVTTSIIAGVVLIIALAFLFVFQPKSSGNQTDTITVQGISSIKATPDLLSIYFNIETKGKTNAEASNANSEVLKNFTEALIKQGFSEKDIRTENFNVYENIYWENNRQKTDGFKASRTMIIELKADKFDKAGEVIDAGVNAGAGISYINFELTQEAQNRYKAEALKLAAGDAKIKAESIATGFNKKIGKLVSVSVNEFGYTPWNIYSTAASGSSREDVMMAKEVTANIQPTDKEVSASISAVYKMG